MIGSNGLGRQEIKQQIQNARKVVGTLNSFWWNKNISNKIKMRIRQTMDKPWSRQCGLWKKMILAVEMDYIRSSVYKEQLITKSKLECQLSKCSWATSKSTTCALYIVQITNIEKRYIRPAWVRAPNREGIFRIWDQIWGTT